MSLFENEIKGFFGEYRFLSNFYPCKISFGGIDFGSVENVYVAVKTYNFKESRDEHFYRLTKISKMTPGQAKRFGRIGVRPDWTDEFKAITMLYLLKQKFSDVNPELKQLLIATGDTYIEETNTWGDTFWGVCDGVGENVLGNLLMNIRDELIHYGN